MRNLTDNELALRISSGEDACFNELAFRFEKKLVGFFFNRTFDLDLAKDLTQDTFMKVLIQLRKEKYDGKGNFPGWLFRLARNLFVDYQRTQKMKYQEIPNHFDLEYSIDNFFIESSSTIDRLLKQEAVEIVWRAIYALPEKQSKAICLRYQGAQVMAYNEIGLQMGIEGVDAKWNAYKGMKTLRSKLTA